MDQTPAPKPKPAAGVDVAAAERMEGWRRLSWLELRDMMLPSEHGEPPPCEALPHGNVLVLISRHSV